MKQMLIAASAIFGAVLAISSINTANAIVINPGETIRDSYLLSGTELQPTSYDVTFGTDILDPGDEFSISLFDSQQNHLGFTHVVLAANQAGGRTSIFVPLSRPDFLPSGIGPADPVRIPSTGFIEISGIVGSLDIDNLRLIATDRSTIPGTISTTTLDNFAYVSSTTPVPIPASIGLLPLAIFSATAMNRAHCLRQKNKRD